MGQSILHVCDYASIVGGSRESLWAWDWGPRYYSCTIPGLFFFSFSATISSDSVSTESSLRSTADLLLLTGDSAVNNLRRSAPEGPDEALKVETEEENGGGVDDIHSDPAGPKQGSKKKKGKKKKFKKLVL